jgi:acetyltransferase-like isoleucine patch superfamily enzyme
LRIRIRLAGGQCGRYLWVGRGLVIKWPVHAGLHLGDRVRLGEYCVLDVPFGGQLRLGDRVTLTMGAVIASAAWVELGDDTIVGEYASIRDADHGMDLASPMRTQRLHAEPVCLGNDVWIGRGACVLRGVTVGCGAVIGANSVVTRSVEAGHIAVGAPARILRSRVSSLV